MSSDEFIAARRTARARRGSSAMTAVLTYPGRIIQLQVARCLENRWPPVNNGTEGN